MSNCTRVLTGPIGEREVFDEDEYWSYESSESERGIDSTEFAPIEKPPNGPDKLGGPHEIAKYSAPLPASLQQVQGNLG